MNGSKVGEKLREYAQSGVSFSKHAEIRMKQRNIDAQLVENHLKNPETLKLAEKLPSQEGEEKYKLWFVPSKRTAYIYVIVLKETSHNITVVTAARQKLAWQKKVQKHAR